MSLPISSQDLEAETSAQTTPLTSRYPPGNQGMSQGLLPPPQPRPRQSVTFGQTESTTVEFSQSEQIQTGFNTPSNPRRSPAQRYGLNPDYLESESKYQPPRMPNPGNL